jgi:microcin C transport system permease protein
VLVQDLVESGGVLQTPAGQPFTGKAFTAFKENPENRYREFTVVNGKFHGEAIAKDKAGVLVERLIYNHGVEKSRQELQPGVDHAALLAATEPTYRQLLYPPTPPSIKQRHFLGTDTSGNDVLAVAFGGFQMAVGTSLYYVPLVYLVGIIVGCLMGYFGSWVDLGGQRVLEIWGAIPFLFVVILVRSVLPNPTALLVTTLLASFGWLGIAAYMRTGAYREKTRDYVAAARLQGASTGRIIFQHVLPNSLATIVTLIPFTVDHLIFSMTALDYLGFGLPAGTPTWGAMLSEGADNLHASWILLTGFAALVIVLVLVTFVGEAIREAFDPKRFTTYR